MITTLTFVLKIAIRVSTNNRLARARRTPRGLYRSYGAVTITHSNIIVYSLFFHFSSYLNPFALRKMPKNKKTSNKSRASRRLQRQLLRQAGLTQFFVEELSFSCKMGSSVSLTLANLKGLAQNVCFRPVFIEVRVSDTAYVPGTTTLPGYYAPCAIQLRYMERTATEKNTGMKSLTSGKVTRLRIDIPVTEDPLSPGLELTFVIGQIDAICLGTVGAEAFVRGFIRIGVAHGREVYNAPCPSQHITSDDDLHHSFEHVGLSLKT